MSSPSEEGAAVARYYCSGCADYSESKTLMCSRCKAARFCSKECQTRSWPAHKKVCRDTIIWTNPPPSSRVTKDRMVALVDGLSAPDVDELKSTLRDLEQSLRSKSFNPDAIGHMGALPGLCRLLRRADTREGSLQVLALASTDQKTNATLLFLCGGIRQLADMLFVPQHPPVPQELTPLVLLTLVSAVASADDPVVPRSTLSKYSAVEVLVPRLLSILEVEGIEEGKASRRHADTDNQRVAETHAAAAKLLTFCITLDVEVPLTVWKEGFARVRGLVGHYHLGLEGVERGTVGGLLVDLMELIDGFIEHFQGAVDLVLQDGLDVVLGQLLLSPVRVVKLRALGLARVALVYSDKPSSADRIVACSECRVVQQAALICEEAVESKDHEMARAALALLSVVLRSDSALSRPYLDSIFSSAAQVVQASRSFSGVADDAVSVLKEAAMHLDPSTFSGLVLSEGGLRSLPDLVVMSPAISGGVLDLFVLIAERLGSEGAAFLRDIGAPEAAARLFTSTELPPRHHLIPALAALRAILLADTDALLPQLRQNTKLKERLEELAASDVNFQYLSEVAGGADPWSTPVCFTDWIELAGLHRSLTRAKADGRVLMYLTVRNEAHCSISRAAFQEGDPIVRLDKCLHWTLQHQMRSLVLQAVLGPEEADRQPADGPWSIAPAAARPPLDLRCPVCKRTVAVEVRD